MSRVHRFDRAELRPPRRRVDGSTVYDAKLSRVGVFPYRQPDGTIRREYRPPEEVGRADSLASLELAPVTDGHPSKPGQAKGLAVGAVGDTVKFDGAYVTASIVVYDDGVNDRIRRGDARELSPGYTVRLDETPGVTPDGEPYDVIQRDIIYEHAAVVKYGRQGSTVAPRVDAAADGWRCDAVINVAAWGVVTVSVTSDTLSQDKLEAAVRTAAQNAGMTIRSDRADGIEVVAGWAESKGRAHVQVSSREMSVADLTAKLKAALASADVTVAAGDDPPRADRADGRMEPIMDELQKKLTQSLADLAAATARADAAEAKLKAETARADKSEAERDAARERADAAEKARADAAIAAPAQIRARLALEDQAAKVLGADFKLDGLSDTAVKAAVVEKLIGKPLPADKVGSADYVAARFDVAMEEAAQAAQAGSELRAATVASGDKPAVRADGWSEAVAREELRERNRKKSMNTAA